MRLDEWQQFIESQFLDDQVVGKPPSAREAAVPNEPEAPDVIEPLVVVPALEAGQQQPVTVPDSQIVVPAATVVTAPIEAQAAHPELLPESAPRQDYSEIITTDLPDFSAYLKPRKKREAEPAPIPSPRQQEPQKRSAPKAREPRKSRSHARHARNVAPAPVESGISAAELWGQVPRHIHTLLALGREDEEVAQFSYKRDFAESRQQLIARLIDPVLTLEETARLLNVCPTTVRRYTNRGILSHYRKQPEAGVHDTGEKETRQRRFRLSDILAFLEAQHGAVPEHKS